MNFKRNLKNVNLYLFFGIFLIFIGIVFFFQKQKIEIVPSSSPTSPIPPTSPTPTLSFAKVTKVIDGDTIIIDSGQKIRYIGMNTPELETNECFATKAADINRDMVLGKEVRLEKDTSETDKYGRLLRYVYVNDDSGGNEMVNNELLEIGLAKIETVPPDIKYKDEFLQSEKFAEENNLGLWGKCL